MQKHKTCAKDTTRDTILEINRLGKRRELSRKDNQHDEKPGPRTKLITITRKSLKYQKRRVSMLDAKTN